MFNNSQSPGENTQMLKLQLIDHHILLMMLATCGSCRHFHLTTTPRPVFFRLLQAIIDAWKSGPPTPASGTVGAEGVTWPHSLLRSLDFTVVTLTPLYTHTSSPLHLKTLRCQAHPCKEVCFKWKWTSNPHRSRRLSFKFWMVLGDRYLGWSNVGIPDCPGGP